MALCRQHLQGVLQPLTNFPSLFLPHGGKYHAPHSQATQFSRRLGTRCVSELGQAFPDLRLSLTTKAGIPVTSSAYFCDAAGKRCCEEPSVAAPAPRKPEGAVGRGCRRGQQEGAAPWPSGRLLPRCCPSPFSIELNNQNKGVKGTAQPSGSHPSHLLPSPEVPGKG